MDAIKRCDYTIVDLVVLLGPWSFAWLVSERSNVVSKQVEQKQHTRSHEKLSLRQTFTSALYLAST